MVWTETHLYGSSRLGTFEPNQRLTPSVDTLKKGRLVDGQRRYELTNHLGNVLVTVNDRKQGREFNLTSFSYNFFEAVVIQATDYFPFGLEMPGRTFQAASTTAYRMGFNGKENDRNGSWSGTQLVQDYGMRLYNPAIGRFLSVDPLTASYPFFTPYQFAGNMPIIAVDIDGAEPLRSNIIDIEQIGTYNVYWQNFSKGIKPRPNKDRTYSVYKGTFNSMSRYLGRTVIALRSDFDVDNDNSTTRTGGPQQGETSFEFEGNFINSDEVSFFVKPTQGDIGKDLKKNNVSLGDLAVAFRVSENGEVVSSIGIIADNGPKGMTGEGSTQAARDLGLPTDPNTGGSPQNDVFFFFFPGTKHYWDKVSETYTDENGNVQTRSLQERIEEGFNDLLKDIYLNQKNNTYIGLIDFLKSSLNSDIKNQLFEQLNKDKTYQNFDEPPVKD